MGSVNIDNTGSGADVTLSSDGTDLLLDGTAIGGGGADLFADNDVSATAPTASGDNSVAIGNDAQATSTNSIAIGSTYNGSGARATTGTGAIAIGGSRATGTESFAAMIGSNSSSGAQGTNSVAIGFNANATSTSSHAIGSNTTSTGYGSLAIGREAYSIADRSTAITNSYASGANSFAAAIANNTSSYGATGASSVAMGYQAKVTTNNGIAIGWRASCTAGSVATAIGALSSATGWSSTVIGGESCSGTDTYASALGGYQSQATGYASTVAGGFSNNASGFGSIVTGGRGNTANYNYTRAGGYEALSGARWGKDVWASGEFSSQGDAQTGTMVLRSDTTDATAEALTSDNSTATTDNQIILPNNSAYAFHGTIVARQKAGDGTASAAWKVEGLIRREGSAGTTVLVNSATTVLDNTPSWGLALSADTTNGGLKIEATGAASTNIRWVATIHTSEVTYA